MGAINLPDPVKLFVGVIFSSEPALKEAIGHLCGKYGVIDQESERWNFDFTTYYDAEMGRPLWRQFFSFKNLITPEQLKQVKIYTNQLEDKLASRYPISQRPVNLDPGYLSLSKVILATTKDFSHRIYLGDGIYAEVTLYYTKKNFHSWEWTFPDYRTKIYHDFFAKLRLCYRRQLSHKSP